MRAINLPLLTFALALNSLGAIAFVNATDLSNNGGSGNLSVAYSVTAGSNEILFAYAVGDTSVDNVTAATYNGASMTLLGKQTPTSARWSYLFALVNPPSGSHTLVLTCTTGFCGSIAAVYSGVSQTGLPDAVTTNTSGSASSLATSLTSVSNNCWFLYVGYNGVGSNTGDAFTTMRVANGIFGSSWVADSNGPKTPAGSYTMTASEGGGPVGWTAVMISMAPAGAVSFSNAQVIIF